MPLVMTTAGTVECGHGNAVGVTSSRPLTVDGSPVLTASEIQSGTEPTTDPPESSDSGGPIDVPCTTFAVSGGTAQALTTAGTAVVLDTLGGTTNGLEGKNPAIELSCGAPGQQALTAT